MRVFVAHTPTKPFLRAWLNPEDSNDVIDDPRVPRNDGWRVVIELLENGDVKELVRSTWEPTIDEALAHVNLRWPTKPEWFDHGTKKRVHIEYKN